MEIVNIIFFSPLWRGLGCINNSSAVTALLLPLTIFGFRKFDIFHISVKYLEAAWLKTQLVISFLAYFIELELRFIFKL